jgi:DNA-binding NtrC family response regulator
MGCTFKVYLPSSEGFPEDTEDQAVDNQKLPGGTETILLVEDEEQVRNLANSILTRLGYKVLVAEHGKEALGIIESYSEKVDLLLTDVVMPQMNGRELFSLVSEEHPDLEVLFMSCYSEHVISHRIALGEVLSLRHKPFNMQTIATKVREILDK